MIWVERLVPSWLLVVGSLPFLSAFGHLDRRLQVVVRSDGLMMRRWAFKRMDLVSWREIAEVSDGYDLSAGSRVFDVVMKSGRRYRVLDPRPAMTLDIARHLVASAWREPMHR